MQAKHVIKRGNSFHFVLRVPADLALHFPTGTISRSLKTKDKKQAAVLANATEYEAQRLFMRLRTGMLDKSLETYLINTFLLKGVKRIEAQCYGENYEKDKFPDNPLEQIFDAHAERSHSHIVSWREAMSKDSFGDMWPELLEDSKALLQSGLKNKHEDAAPIDLDYLASEIKKHTGARLSDTDRKRLGLRLIDAQIQLSEAEASSLSGQWTPLRTLRASAARALSTPYVAFADLIKKYLEYYENKNVGITRKQMQTVETECRVLLEILGSVGVDSLNCQTAVESLHKALRRYPKKRQHMKGKLSAVLGKDEPIGVDRANKYIKRMGYLIDYAFKEKFTLGANIFKLRGAMLIDKNGLPVDKKVEQYDIEDLVSLIDALCTQPLWINGPPKPERIWAVLVTIFTGLRPGNVVSLRKEHIKARRSKDGNVFYVMDLSHGKNNCTIRPVVIPEVLELLGFVEWALQQPDGELFQDTPKTFSAWYNNKQNGFEWRYVTKNPRKKFYSLRHNYAGEVYGLSEDIKVTGEAMGHASGGITNRYIKAARPARLKELVDQVGYEGIDLERLYVRALELFPYLTDHW